MTDVTLPDFETFVRWPHEKIVGLIPETVICSIAGTRRSAALVGISPESDQYAYWLRWQMITFSDRLFQYGVKHVYQHLISPKQFQEVGPYRENLIRWLHFLITPEAIEDYLKRKWRVRLIGAKGFPALQEIANTLEQATSQPDDKTLWLAVIPNQTWIWNNLLETVIETGAKTQKEAIRAFYGEEIPPAKLLLSTGKLLISTETLPPLLTGDTQCYWLQKPGYTMSTEEFQRILYDYSYVRQTWRQDKTGRAETAITYRETWENAPILGLGKRLGPFWYPEIENRISMSEKLLPMMPTNLN